MKLGPWAIPRPVPYPPLVDAADVVLGFGSSLGDRLHHLRRGLLLLLHGPDIRICNLSSVWQTQPIGTAKNYFYNMCVHIQTTLTPPELLNRLLEVEKKCGRIRGVHWMDRTLDIDILLFENLKWKTERLIVPHPRMLERLFVMIPLREIQPTHPLVIEWETRHGSINPLKKGMWSVGRFAFVKPMGIEYAKDNVQQIRRTL